MDNFLDSIKNLIGLPSRERFSRAEARELLLKHIDPVLNKAGFNHRNKNKFWRIGECKTDLLELNFCGGINESKDGYPASSFYFEFGCYYHFIPYEVDTPLPEAIPGLITPHETNICHYRGRPVRTIYQQPRKFIKEAWHLDETHTNLEVVLEDIKSQLEKEAFTPLNNLNKIENWIDILNGKNYTPTHYGHIDGIGSNEYLLGFTYLYTKNYSKAIQQLTVAKQFAVQQASSLKKLPAHYEIDPNIDVYKKPAFIQNVLNDIEKRF